MILSMKAGSVHTHPGMLVLLFTWSLDVSGCIHAQHPGN